MPASSPPLDVQLPVDFRLAGTFQLTVIVLGGLVVLLDGLDTEVAGYLAPSVVMFVIGLCQGVASGFPAEPGTVVATNE